MRIEYAHNPLASKVYLDLNDNKLLFWKYMWEMLDDEIWRLADKIKDVGNTKDLDQQIQNKPLLEHYKKFQQEILSNPFDTVYNELDKIWTKMIHTEYDVSKIQSFIEALQDEHDGDCVNQPSSCLKCYAESLLNIESVPNLKYWGGTASQISGAFFNPITEKKDRTIEQAIDFLKSKNYNSKEYKQWESHHVDRWQQQTYWAIEYLEYYRIEILQKGFLY